MSTQTKKKPRIILDTEEVTQPVTYAEYLRRKNHFNQLRDKLAGEVNRRNLQLAIDSGFIKVVQSGNNLFIDWGKKVNREFIFKTTFKPDKRRKKSVSQHPAN